MYMSRLISSGWSRSPLVYFSTLLLDRVHLHEISLEYMRIFIPSNLIYPVPSSKKPSGKNSDDTVYACVDIASLKTLYDKNLNEEKNHIKKRVQYDIHQVTDQREILPLILADL